MVAQSNVQARTRYGAMAKCLKYSDTTRHDSAYVRGEEVEIGDIDLVVQERKVRMS